MKKRRTQHELIQLVGISHFEIYIHNKPFSKNLTSKKRIEKNEKDKKYKKV